MHNIKCAGEMSSPVPHRACTVTAVDHYSFGQKFLRQGCGGERTIARARFAIAARLRMVAASARCCTCPDVQSSAHCR